MLLCYALLLQPQVKSLTTISIGNCQDLSSPSMQVDMGMAGTWLREAKTPEVWHSSCQVASSSDGGENTPKKLGGRHQGSFLLSWSSTKWAWSRRMSE